MNNAIYNIIYSKLVSWLTPKMLRNTKMLAWMGILIAPVQTIYQDLIRFRTQKLYQLSITPQVCYLQKLLNDRYDYVARRIRIVDSIEHDFLYIFQDAENKAVSIYTDGENIPTYIFADGESGDSLNDFVVNVPAAVVFNLNEMVSLVKTNKLGAMQFTVQIV